MPVADWPAADRAAWQVALEEFDPLEPGIGYAGRWKASTIRLVESGYGRWLSWLQVNGELDVLSLPGERASRVRVSAYLRALRAAGLSGFTVANHIQQLGNGLRAMAPQGDWSWILRAAGRIRDRAHSVKNLDLRMRAPEELLQLGLDLMATAERDDMRINAIERSVRFRDGLLIALLTLRPMRISNVAEIEIGRHLHRRSADWWLGFSASAMKGGRTFEFSWPSQLANLLDQYLDSHRLTLANEALGPAASNALWLTVDGKPLTAARLSERITIRTAAAYGHAINPHTFRHIAATTISATTPENVTDVARVLSHSSMRTSEKHYIRARMVEAGRTYQSTLRELRGSAKGDSRRSLPR